MGTFGESFATCGFDAYGVLVTSIVAGGFALLVVACSLARARFAKPLAGVALVLALSPLVFGTFARASARDRVEGEARHAPGDAWVKEKILAEGYADAGTCLSLGIGFSTLPFLLAGAALVIALVRPAPKQPAIAVES